MKLRNSKPRPILIRLVVTGALFVGCAAPRKLTLDKKTSFCIGDVQGKEIQKKEIETALRNVHLEDSNYVGYGCESINRVYKVDVDKTNINGKGRSYFCLLSNIYFPLASGYLAYETKSLWWLLLSAIQISPYSFISYEIKDENGKAVHKSIANGKYWFKDKKESKKELLMDFTKSIQLQFE